MPGLTSKILLQPAEFRLHALNRVEAKIETTVTEADAQGKRFVAISSTSLVRDVLKVPGELMTKFRSVAVPVLTWEPRLFYDLGMIPGAVHHTDWAATRNLSAVTIVAPGHALAGGLSGRVVLTTAPSQLSWARVRPDAVRVGFDCPEHSARKVDYPAYKGHRAAKPDDLTEQILAAPELLRATGVAPLP